MQLPSDLSPKQIELLMNYHENDILNTHKPIAETDCVNSFRLLKKGLLTTKLIVKSGMSFFGYVITEAGKKALNTVI